MPARCNGLAEILCLLLTLSTPSFHANALDVWELGTTGSKESFRAISAPNDEVIWIAGSGGVVLRSADGGTNWQNTSPNQIDKSIQYRSLHAWDQDRAIVATAGTPAAIFLTADGGQVWKEVYRHDSPNAFFDGLKFWNASRGIAFSDPVDGNLLVVETRDGGKSWNRIASDALDTAPGEAGFAASNSSLCVSVDGFAMIGLGGSFAETSRVLFSRDWNSNWTDTLVPLRSGPAAGIFSVAVSDRRIVAVGGDYRAGQPSASTCAYSDDRGRSWHLAAVPPEDFRSAIIWLETVDGAWVCVGPTGSDISHDGSHWRTLGDQPFHALTATKSWLYAVGADGRFGRAEIQHLPAAVKQ